MSVLIETLNCINIYFLDSILPPKVYKKSPESPKSPPGHIRVFTSYDGLPKKSHEKQKKVYEKSALLFWPVAVW